MAARLKDYLKKYQSVGNEDKQPKNSKMKQKVLATQVPAGLTIIDDDVVWQKNIDMDSDEPEEEGDNKLQMIEEIKVKRMHQMEKVKQHRLYMSIGDDESGSTIISPRMIPQEHHSLLIKRKPLIDYLDLSPPRRKHKSSREEYSIDNQSPPRKMIDGRQAGLIIMNKQERPTELEKKEEEKARMLRTMPEGGGQAAATVYRDKHGKRLEGLVELVRQQQEAVTREVKPLEWGKGLAQHREAEVRYAELEAEKAKPFARSCDDPEMDKMYRERDRWGDPMAHLVKRKADLIAAELVDPKASEEMKALGYIIPQDFIIPQGIPHDSWLKRGRGRASLNRYGIKPGRHWDGEDRSIGFESRMFSSQG